MFPVRYELGFHVPEDGILNSRRRETLKCYIIARIISISSSNNNSSSILSSVKFVIKKLKCEVSLYKTYRQK
jgi:hypothetical protein